VITYGTGAAFSHMLEFLWFDDGLYIVESTAPVIKRTPWRTLIQERYDGAFSLVYMPLTAEARTKFDELKAREFYYQMEG